MENLDMYNLKNNYKNNGTILVDYLDKLNPFTEDDIKKLAQYCKMLRKNLLKLEMQVSQTFKRWKIYA